MQTTLQVGSSFYSDERVEYNHQGQGYSFDLRVKIKSLSREGWIYDFGFDVRSEAESLPYPVFKNFSYVIAKNTWQINLGLQKNVWSQLDEDFQMGLWNSITRYEALQGK
ncbi:MAG: hypothetical protein R2827_02915 [Bdellovibrionales bacterium]